jgi:hypothetical protein
MAVFSQSFSPPSSRRPTSRFALIPANSTSPISRTSANLSRWSSPSVSGPVSVSGSEACAHALTPVHLVPPQRTTSLTTRNPPRSRSSTGSSLSTRSRSRSMISTPAQRTGSGAGPTWRTKRSKGRGSWRRRRRSVGLRGISRFVSRPFPFSRLFDQLMSSLSSSLLLQHLFSLARPGQALQRLTVFGLFGFLRSLFDPVPCSALPAAIWHRLKVVDEPSGERGFLAQLADGRRCRTDAYLSCGTSWTDAAGRCLNPIGWNLALLARRPHIPDVSTDLGPFRAGAAIPICWLSNHLPRFAYVSTRCLLLCSNGAFKGWSNLRPQSPISWQRLPAGVFTGS